MIDVLVVGAGPTGLTAAIEARRHGLSVRIVDGSHARSRHSKALVLHSRSLEILADMGFVDAVLRSGREFRALNIHAGGRDPARIDFRAIDWQDAIYPFWLSIPQSETERCLEEHLGRHGVTVERSTRLTRLEPRGDRVLATLRRADEAGGGVGAERTVEAAWLVGCDGASSTTRKLCRIPFEGSATADVFILGDVRIDWGQAEDEGFAFLASDGIFLVVPLPEPRRYRIIAHMPELTAGDEPVIDLALLQELMDRRTGITARLRELAWHSSFSVKHLVAARHRRGRVFLAGDAAHIHSPVGGQGLNTGIQDAYNLIWKLALVHRGRGTEALLDSYELERHQVAEATIRKVAFATRLVTLKHPLSRSLRNRLAAIVVDTDAVRNRFGRDVGMLDIRYPSSGVVHEDGRRRGRVGPLRKAFGNGAFPARSPRSGERCPNVLFLDARGSPHSLVDRLYGTRHLLLLFAGRSDKHPSSALRRVRERIERRYAAVVRCLLVATAPVAESAWGGEVVVNPDGALHRRFGATREALYLCRPDHHIGYRSQPVAPEAFFEYLERIFIPEA